HRRVAELTDVGARVGEAEHAALSRQQPRDALDVVVAERLAEARAQVVLDRERAERIEGRAAALARERGEAPALELRAVGALAHGEGPPARAQHDARELRLGAAAPLRVAIAGDAVLSRPPDQLGDDRGAREAEGILHRDLEGERTRRDLRPDAGAGGALLGVE